VMLTTPPGWRPIHFEAAVNAGKHVFTEKPIATDPTGTRRFIEAARKAQEKKLTVMSGAQRRSSSDFIETIRKLQDGAIGEVLAAYSNYLSRPVMHAKARDPKWADAEWEHRNWYSFVWLCGDQIVEQHFHNIDCINWAMNAHPVKVVASGGAVWRPREELYGNIYDHVTSDFVYPNGVHLSSSCRQLPDPAYTIVNDLIVGSKGRTNCRDLGTAGLNGQVQEHIEMLKSIRGDGPYINHGLAVAESTMTCIMARESAYSGQEITWEQAMASKQDLMPRNFDMDMKMTPPALPVPGVYKFV
ncbi:MAG: Gfo/Idh/MocA family protein, partial [Terriglobales bacterium]